MKIIVWFYANWFLRHLLIFDKYFSNYKNIADEHAHFILSHDVQITVHLDPCDRPRLHFVFFFSSSYKFFSPNNFLFFFSFFLLCFLCVFIYFSSTMSQIISIYSSCGCLIVIVYIPIDRLLDNGTFIWKLHWCKSWHSWTISMTTAILYQNDQKCTLINFLKILPIDYL